MSSSLVIGYLVSWTVRWWRGLGPPFLWPLFVRTQSTKLLEVWQRMEQRNPKRGPRWVKEWASIDMTRYYIHIMQTPIREASVLQGFAKLSCNGYFPGRAKNEGRLTSVTWFLPRRSGCLLGPILITASFSDWSRGTLVARRLKISGLKHWICMSSFLRTVNRYPPAGGPVMIEASWSYEKHNEWTSRVSRVSICRWKYGMAEASQATLTPDRRKERNWRFGRRTRHHPRLKKLSVMSKGEDCTTNSKLRCRRCDWWASKNMWWPTRLVNSKLRTGW